MSKPIQLFTSLRYDPALLSSTPNTDLNAAQAFVDEPGLAPCVRHNSRGPEGPSPFYMLAYHRDRILEACDTFGWGGAGAGFSGPPGLLRLDAKLREEIGDVKRPRRVKVVLHSDGNSHVETNETPEVPARNLFPKALPPPMSEAGEAGQSNGDAGEEDGIPKRDPEKQWTILIDSSRTSPSNYTRVKTTGRDMYDSARERAGIKSMTEPKEVLLVSTNDEEIMEGSLTTPYFWRGGRWVTPPVGSGGQRGTTRRWALEKGVCVEEVVRVGELRDGEECWVSNGVRGWIWGRIKL